jgi:hypothetical protein
VLAFTTGPCKHEGGACGSLVRRRLAWEGHKQLPRDHGCSEQDSTIGESRVMERPACAYVLLKQNTLSPEVVVIGVNVFNINVFDMGENN